MGAFIASGLSAQLSILGTVGRLKKVSQKSISGDSSIIYAIFPVFTLIFNDDGGFKFPEKAR